jgi:hypothetical protein
MAETIKVRKLTLRDILDEIAADEEFSDEERELAREKVKEMEFKKWSSQQMKLNR